MKIQSFDYQDKKKEKKNSNFKEMIRKCYMQIDGLNCIEGVMLLKVITVMTQS